MLSPYTNTIGEYKDLYGDRWRSQYRLDKKAIDNPSKTKPSSKKKKQYYKTVKQLTEDNKEQIEGIDKRGYYTQHIDHKISIAEGFALSIPPDIIAHPSNLRMIPAEENMAKKDSRYIDEKNKWILEKYMVE